MKKVVEYNGKILYPKTLNEKDGFYVAEFEDSEGNRIAVQQIFREWSFTVNERGINDLFINSPSFQY